MVQVNSEVQLSDLLREMAKNINELSNERLEDWIADNLFVRGYMTEKYELMESQIEWGMLQEEKERRSDDSLRSLEILPHGQ